MSSSDLEAAMGLDALSMPVPWSAGVWRAELADESSLYLFAEEDGTLVGQIGTKRAADELHVLTLAVHPEHRRRGVGGLLLGEAARRSPEARAVFLEVRESNLAARSFYNSVGFLEVGTRPRYYGDEDARVMRLDLPRR